MDLKEVKNNFHNLIDNLNDAELLINFYEGLLSSSDDRLANELSEKGRNEILSAYEESEDENNLIDNELVKEKLKKWL